MNNNEIKILCIIPARSGSKGLPGKNIMNFKGKPMLTWSIEHAQKCKYTNNIRIIVSTDSENWQGDFACSGLKLGGFGAPCRNTRRARNFFNKKVDQAMVCEARVFSALWRNPATDFTSGRGMHVHDRP